MNNGVDTALDSGVNSAMLQVTQLHYGYGERAVLRGIDLTVKAGEVVSLVGPNGAGKSTLLKCVNGVLTPIRGQVTLDGRPTNEYGRRELARAIAYVPQQHGPAISLSVVDMIALGRAPHRTLASAARDRELVLDLIEQLGLQPLALRSFAALSGGERQRVLLGRALAQGDRLLLLDEPTSALDLKHQLDTMTTVRALASARGCGVLIAIHDLALASRFSDRLVLLGDGQVRADGPWRDVLAVEHVEAVYGVSAIVGTDRDLPYVIPVRSELRAL
jgi:iron complex transport system ATP-binding protein